jgi:hypothetical protein
MSGKLVVDERGGFEGGVASEKKRVADEEAAWNAPVGPREDQSKWRQDAFSSFERKTEEKVREYQSDIARGSARRGMYTSGQAAAAQRQVRSSGTQAMADYDVGLERVERDWELSERQMDWREESTRLQHSLGLKQLEQAEMAGYGKMGGVGLGLWLGSLGAAAPLAAAMGPMGLGLMGVAALGALFD